MSDMDYHTARQILADIDVEERNWRIARTKIGELVELADKAAKTLGDLDRKIQERQSSIGSLEGVYNDMLVKLQAKVKEAEVDAKTHLASLDKSVSTAKANAEAKTKEANKTVMDADQRVTDSAARIKAAEDAVNEWNLKLEKVKKDYNDFVKKIAGGA